MSKPLSSLEFRFVMVFMYLYALVRQTTKMHVLWVCFAGCLHAHLLFSITPILTVQKDQQQGDGGDNTISSDPVERPNRVEAGDVPKNVPHATDGASVVEADDNNRVIDATASAPKAKPQAEPEKPVDKKPDTGNQSNNTHPEE